MRQFSEFNITLSQRAFTGDKIKIERLFNREIIVHDFKIEQSKLERGSGKCLHLQVELNGTRYVVFSGSVYLMEQIEQINRANFPFKTTIIKQNDHHEFT